MSAQAVRNARSLHGEFYSMSVGRIGAQPPKAAHRFLAPPVLDKASFVPILVEPCRKRVYHVSALRGTWLPLCGDRL